MSGEDFNERNFTPEPSPCAWGKLLQAELADYAHGNTPMCMGKTLALPDALFLSLKYDTKNFAELLLAFLLGNFLAIISCLAEQDNR